MNIRSVLSILATLLIAAAGPGFIDRAWGQGIRTEIHPVASGTLSEEEFLIGGSSGQPAMLAGELRLPRTSGRLPVVVLVHGSGGIGSGVTRWAEALNTSGFGTFVMDHFSGRGILQTATDQTQLAHVAMIADVYRALDLLARHPRVDPTRIAVMGFSKGGFAALYASLKRFQRMHAPGGLEFAAYVAFYPICIRTYIDDEQVSDRAIRIFHGAADDWVPVEPCRDYVTRLRRAGKDATLTGIPALSTASTIQRCRRRFAFRTCRPARTVVSRSALAGGWCSGTPASRSAWITGASGVGPPWATTRRRSRRH